MVPIVLLGPSFLLGEASRKGLQLHGIISLCLLVGATDLLGGGGGGGEHDKTGRRLLPDHLWPADGNQSLHQPAPQLDLPQTSQRAED